MKKTFKVLSSGALAFGMIFSTTAISANLTGNEAEAATEPWYKYTGNTGHDGSFILDQTFLNAVTYSNVTINGYRIYGSYDDFMNHQNTTMMNVYDQNIMKFANGKAVGVKFPVKKGAVSKKQLFDVYGKTKNVAPSDGVSSAVYFYNVADQRIKVSMTDGYVTQYQLGGDIMIHN